MTLRGGECAEDLSEHLRHELPQVRFFDVNLVDNLLKKKPTTNKETYILETDISHGCNVNLAMNHLVVKLLVKFKQLNTHKNEHIFYYDNQFTPTTEKYNSKRIL